MGLEWMVSQKLAPTEVEKLQGRILELEREVASNKPFCSECYIWRNQKLKTAVRHVDEDPEGTNNGWPK